ncbi:MAG: hypothetical protein H2069_03130 [Legionella sp.]|nr:hypothetical protein [Legionella sp.]
MFKDDAPEKQNADILSKEIQALSKELKSFGNELKKMGQRKLDEAQHYIEDCSEGVTKTVQEKPLQSLLTAVGIGFVLSLLLKK